MANRITNDSLRAATLEELALRHARNVTPEKANDELRRFDTNEQRSQFLRGIARK